MEAASAAKLEKASEKLQIPTPHWAVGTKWRHELTSTNDIEIERGAVRSHKVRTRHEIIEERLLALDGENATTEVVIVEKSITTKDLLKGSTQDTRDLAAGKTYKVQAVGRKVTVFRGDVEVHGNEASSVAESSLDFGQLTRFPIPPLAVGDTFQLGGGTRPMMARLDRVHDGTAEIMMTSTLSVDDQKLEGTQHARVRIADGRVLYLETDTVGTRPDGADGTVFKPVRTTSSETYTYEPGN